MILNIKQGDIKKLVKLAIKEDIKNGDVTTRAIFNKNDVSEARIISKEKGIYCGTEMLEFVYSMINKKILVNPVVKDGTSVKPGQEVIKIVGPTIGILEGERIALNFIQRMSGIATSAERLTAKLKNPGIKILDTRKTLPGFRLLDKYAVQMGGGSNHRMGLYDMVMIKDNHIKAAGSIKKAVQLVKNKYKNKFKIEVETTSLKEVEEAIACEVDIIMLDNMDVPLMKKAIKMIDGKTKIEISGNVNYENITKYQRLKIDFISIGALTHSVMAFDLSMKF